MKLQKKIIYKGREITLELIKRENFQKEIVVFPNTVAILPLISKRKIILIRQYRFPAKKELWEIPAGKLKKGEKPEMGAKRELREETGFQAGKLEKIGEFYLSPGYLTEYMHLFRATFLKKGDQSFDKDEIIKDVKIFDLKKAFEMIKKKKIIDAKTILAILLQMKSKI